MDETPQSAQAVPEGLFQALLRHSVDAIVLLERDTRRFIDFSDSWCEMTGFTREELIRRTGGELGLTRAEEQVTIAQRVSAGRNGVFDIRLWRRDGEPRRLEHSSPQVSPNLDLVLPSNVPATQPMQQRLRAQTA